MHTFNRLCFRTVSHGKTLDPGTRWLVLRCGGVRGPLEPLESFGVLGLCSRHMEALASCLSLFLRVPGARIPVRDGLCCGVEGSAVLWSLWSPLESWTSAVDTRKQSIVQGLHVGSKGTQRDDRKRHLLLCRGVCSCRIHVECYFLMNFYSFESSTSQMSKCHKEFQSRCQ